MTTEDTPKQTRSASSLTNRFRHVTVSLKAKGRGPLRRTPSSLRPRRDNPSAGHYSQKCGCVVRHSTSLMMEEFYESKSSEEVATWADALAERGDEGGEKEGRESAVVGVHGETIPPWTQRGGPGHRACFPPSCPLSTVKTYTFYAGLEGRCNGKRGSRWEMEGRWIVGPVGGWELQASIAGSSKDRRCCRNASARCVPHSHMQGMRGACRVELGHGTSSLLSHRMQSVDAIAVQMNGTAVNARPRDSSLGPRTWTG